MIRDDPELGPVRLCVVCKEWWPNETPFYKDRYATCSACRADKANARPIPLRPLTHGSTVDMATKRARDRVRKAELRRDPVLGDKLRARQRAAQRRYYERNQEACREKTRARYAATLDRPVRVGYGRPRIVA